MNEPDAWSLAAPLCLAIPAVFALAALSQPRSAEQASAFGFVTALGISVSLALGSASPGATPLGVRVDAVTCVMLLLVCGIGFVIARYSRTYLHGDPRIATYFRWLLLTLSAVTALVIAGHLLVIGVAWTVTSLTLHQLLTYYPDRSVALVVAHKKFLLSRLADACFWTCLVLIQVNVGSLDLDRIADWAGAHPGLTPSMHAAAILAVVAVALRSAQLPFHGWLMQVMEAPTPVSALLHAGVVNIGGFLLIRLAPLMVHAPAAQALLVGIGLVTATVAALVMTTRVSVKVALAWSTCAQMGFMLVQCGLGAWHLALLHLVAHSLYKAHAFLSAGSAVDGWRLRELMGPRRRPSPLLLGAATVTALAGAAAGVVLLERFGPSPPSTDASQWVLAIIVALAVVPMVGHATAGGALSMAVRAASAAGVATLFVAWHTAAGHLWPVAESPSASTRLGWVLVGAGFVALFAVKATLTLHPEGPLARRLHPWLFAGLYLDERFTRLTFRIWPPPLQTSAAAPAVRVPGALEART